MGKTGWGLSAGPSTEMYKSPVPVGMEPTSDLELLYISFIAMLRPAVHVTLCVCYGTCLALSVPVILTCGILSVFPFSDWSEY